MVKTIQDPGCYCKKSEKSPAFNMEALIVPSSRHFELKKENPAGKAEISHILG